MENFNAEEIYEANRRIAAYNIAQHQFEEDVLVLLWLNAKKKRRTVHTMYAQRNSEGAHIVLVDRYLMDDDTKFKQYFRLSPLLFASVLESIKNDLEGIPTTWNRNPMTPSQKLCITLRYLATGETFASLAFQFRAHRSTIGKIVSTCLKSIVKRLLNTAMPEPTSDALKQNIAEFSSKWNYPNCCGAIDGKHMRIKCPPKAGSAFFNYKDFHSIVLLAIVDANYKFIAVDVGSYGREGDAGIYLKSGMGQKINNDKFNIPPPITLPYTEIILPNVILGDEAFSLHKNLMKPYPRQQSLHDRSKAIYNYRHSRARRTTENTFGIMASYFRVFFTPIGIATPTTIDNLVIAACILHNMMRAEKINSPVEAIFGNIDETITMPTENMIPISRSTAGGRPHNEGSMIREKFKDYFNGIGAVDWQNRVI